MRSWTAPASLLLALILCLPHAPATAQGGVPAADAAAQDAAAQHAVRTAAPPVFEDAPCPFPVPRSVRDQVRCGGVEVLENRAAPDGRRLRLSVAILKSTSPTPRPDPVVFLMGGPGQGFVQHAGRVAASREWAFARAERDLILYDQRGTGFSDPAFCPWLDVKLGHLGLQGLGREVFAARARTLLARCAAELAGAGVDLSRYNSVVSAHDLQDVRQALGVAEWNVWGVSYGGRLALEALRTAPHGIRTVVLDSPSPPNAPHWADGAANLVDVMERTFARCAADVRCAAAFPDAEQRFWQAVEALDREPLTVPTRGPDGAPASMRLTGGLLAGGVFRGLYRPGFHAALPLLMRELEAGNRDLLGNLARQLQVPSGVMSAGLHWTVECNEVAPFNGPAARPSSLERRAALLDRVGFGPDGAECDALHPYRAAPEQAAAVVSDVPVLIIAGALDPVTPAAYSRLAAATLPNARVVELPGGGHWELHKHECTRRLMNEFLAGPAAPLDVACADSVLPPVFVTDVRLTAGVGRVAMLLAPGASPVILAGAALPLVVLLSGLVGWPAAAAWRRVRKRPRTPPAPFERRARLGAAAVALLAIAFLAGLGFTVMRTMGQNPFVLAVGVPAGAAPLLAVPWLLLAGSVALLVTAAAAWRRGAWTRWRRIHFTAVAAANATLAAALIGSGLV
jgi:pimeloyl-ACP methyl ester carboxylesterase